MNTGITESYRWLYKTAKREREMASRSRVLRKMFKGNRTIKDWVLISLGDINEPADMNRLCTRMFQKGFTTSATKPANLIRIGLFRLMDEDLVDIVDNECTPRQYKLNSDGLLCAMRLWFNELNFDDSWATDAVIGTALSEFPEVMHDALIDANATEEVVEASTHPIYSKWLMAMIKETYAPKS